MPSTGTILLPKTATPAYAQEIAQKSYQAVSTLTPDQQQALQKKIQTSSLGGPLDLLKQAQNAKDLTVLTYDQVTSQYPDLLPRAGAGQDGQPLDMQKMKFLKFTNADGGRVVLGVDPTSYLPFFAAVTRTVGQGSLPSTKSGDEGLVVRGESSGQGNVEILVDAGSSTITVNGKKYTLPAGTTLTSGTPPVVDVNGSDVFVNGVKAIPEK